MASVGGEEVEYESDPEETKISLTMRRREASDDEDEEEERERRELPPRRIDSRVSASESEGAVAEYDDEQSEFEEEELEEDEEIGKVELYGKIGSDVKAMAVELDGAAGVSTVEFLGTNQAEEEEKVNHGVVGGGVYLQDGQLGDNDPDGIGEKAKKENEPYAVPTAGAFYMHDDRFRDAAAGGRHRRNLGGRNLWESKDDRKWGHDKFEEMSMQEKHYGEGRKASRGRNRGRGKIRQERGYPRENRPKTFNNNNRNNVPNNENNSAKNPNNAPKGVRGRGPRRYQSSWIEVSTRNKQHGKSAESDSYAISAKVSEPNSNIESGQIPAKKHVISSLNSVAPPFYPSASSTKEISTTQKYNGQAAPQHRNLPSSVADKSFSMSPSNTMRGKNVDDFIGVNKLSIDDSAPTHTGNPLANSQLQVSGSLWSNPSHYPHSRVQGRGQTSMAKMTYQPISPNNQVNRISNPSQFHDVHQVPVQTHQGSLQASAQQLGQRAQASFSADSAVAATSLEFRESKSPPESSKLNTALVGKGKSVQGNGKGSVPYGGTQVIGASGNSGSSQDVNFPGMPTFLPVMQFGGQHSGGIGVPAVGMAFPGYVSNPGSGSSEMTWLPVLTGPAGALGATYNSPYLSVDGAYHARPSSQIPSLAGSSSKEHNINKPANDLSPSQKQEFVSDEFGQKQHKGRRYTEMKFDQ